MSLRTWSLSRSCALSGVIPRAGCRLVCRVRRPSASVPRSRCRLAVQANELNKWCVDINLNHFLHVEMGLVAPVVLYNWLMKTLAFRAGLGEHLTINATQIHSTSEQKLYLFVLYCIDRL
jgi:hypothetical protein